jgi:hypothetical protein
MQKAFDVMGVINIKMTDYGILWAIPKKNSV